MDFSAWNDRKELVNCTKYYKINIKKRYQKNLITKLKKSILFDVYDKKE